jgi:hypothetical protein
MVVTLILSLGKRGHKTIEREDTMNPLRKGIMTAAIAGSRLGGATVGATFP